MSIAMDEFGNPFVVLREQDKKRRLHGIDAQKANILAARAVASTLRTSLGPKGMDKIIVSPDGDVAVTNDGATILSKMEAEHQCARLLVELSNSQDDEIGDGTTGVVIIAGALLDEAHQLLEKGLHPIRIAEGFESACAIATQRLREIAVNKIKASAAEATAPSSTTTTAEETQSEGSNDSNILLPREVLVKAAMTALSSKVVSSCQRHVAELATDAVLAVADIARRDVNFDIIKVEGRPNGRLEDSRLERGVVLMKELSHPQMAKETRDAKIAILTCPFEPPKPKTKHKLDITTVEAYKKLQDAEQKYFVDMVNAVKKSGANFVICQWGFDDEANHLLQLHKLPSVRWVGGVEMELVAIATRGRIVGRFEDLSEEKLGRSPLIREMTIGTENEQMIVITGNENSKAVTVLLYGGNEMAVEEAKRSFHDAACCVRNLIRNPCIVPGGGASEIAASIAVETAADAEPTLASCVQRAFANALMTIPECLADNTGLNAVAISGEARARQISEKNPGIGVDCMEGKVNDMFEADVWESLHSKISQFELATQVVRMIVKIDDVICPAELDD